VTTSDRDSWGAGKGDMDLRVRLAARIPVAGSDLRITGADRNGSRIRVGGEPVPAHPPSLVTDTRGCCHQRAASLRQGIEQLDRPGGVAGIAGRGQELLALFQRGLERRTPCTLLRMPGGS
jgi:hypothetical protein